jgi:hypothetical protein
MATGRIYITSRHSLSRARRGLKRSLPCQCFHGHSPRYHFVNFVAITIPEMPTAVSSQWGTARINNRARSASTSTTKTAAHTVLIK